MKTVIYVNNYKKNYLKDLILGIILVLVSISGLFMNSKLILKILMYLVPIGLLLYSLNIYKMAFNLRKTDPKHFVIFLIQALILTLLAIYVLIFPIKSLSYIIIIFGVFLIVSGINQMMLTKSSMLSFPSFFIGILCLLFSNQIINTFYTLFLIIILCVGLSKIFNYFYFRKLK